MAGGTIPISPEKSVLSGRPMSVSGFSELSDDQSRISRYLIECIEFGFMRPDELPDIVRDRLPKKAPAVAQGAVGQRPNDGWQSAA